MSKNPGGGASSNPRPDFSDDRFLDALHKSFLNQTTLDLRKEKWTFLNREFTVLAKSGGGAGFPNDSSRFQRP